MIFYYHQYYRLNKQVIQHRIYIHYISILNQLEKGL